MAPWTPDSPRGRLSEALSLGNERPVGLTAEVTNVNLSGVKLNSGLRRLVCVDEMEAVFPQLVELFFNARFELLATAKGQTHVAAVLESSAPKRSHKACSIQHFAPELSRFKNPKILYWIFIPTDSVCLILQAAGGALSTVSSGASQAGVDMALMGLSLQVVAIITFCILFADYMVRYVRSPQYRAEVEADDAKFGPRLKLFFDFMGMATVLIFVRCVYRLAELREGYTGELIRDEPLFIGLEGVMVIVAVYCLMIGHPGLVFKANRQPKTGGRSGGDGIELVQATHDGKEAR